MKILEKFTLMAKGKEANIGIGLGEDLTHNLKILNAALSFLNENKAVIHIIGYKSQINQLLNEPDYQGHESRIKLIISDSPEKIIIEDLKKGNFDAIVRGSLSSSKFLNNIKNKLKISEINRLTLLETSEGFQFFYGPVGIDECNTFEKKISFVKMAIGVLNSLNLNPKISILSGGRVSDIGRDAHVDETIKIAEEVVKYFQDGNSDVSISISHDEILIENSIEKKANLIIAPEGISGNLIYRTLVHLGSGKAYGAIYMDVNHVIIDTSRVGKLSEIIGAFKLALALVK
jgi:putative methanogen marker protein 4